ncbi:non-ribosomal peptide synthetase [Nonomuraea sp. NPDC050404]|uniref:non-ribosomal peptide synthetase n=1 Tax=Nonomuraea sp. NPDC050404 TaxID=3155783 RepID=UPI0033D1F2EC
MTTTVTTEAVPLDPRTLTLHGLVERRAARTPHAAAVSGPDAEWTYAELEERAERIAAGLRARGVRPGELVGMAVERSATAVAVILGIMKHGCAYVPLDPAYPEERLRLIVEDCAPSVVVHGDLEPLGFGAVRAIDAGHLLAERARPEPRPAASAEDAAYVIYTSGSTGRPKGVVVPHRGIVNRILWEGAVYPTGPDDAVLLHTSLSFDISLWEIFTPLSSGARVVVADPIYRDDPRYLVDLMRRESVTCLALVPSLLQALLEEEPGLGGCPRLREVFCGGEALPPGLVRRFFRTVDAGLHNLYGPTEYSIDATYWDCRPGDGDGDASVPIGYPLANTRLHLLDRDGRPVPDGTPGELHVAGLGLALGYLNRPDLTRERFVPEPSGDGRMYRTGDLVRRRPDGALEFLGRVDDQVKVRGFRVEPGEVERALLAVEGVSRAAVVTTGEGADARLLAYVVAEESPERIRAILAERLPDYLVPSLIVPIDRIPLGPTGKLDKAALPVPGHESPRTPERGSRPEAEEGVVAAMFAEILQLDDVPRDGDFFALGGNSLQAVRLLNKLRKHAAPDLPLAVLIERPTVEGIAAAIRGNDQA